MRKNLFSLSNIITALLVMLLVAMIVEPQVKAVFIRGLMKIGLFQPDISALDEQEAAWAEVNASFEYTDGRHVSLEALKGKVVFINLWATWCPPCIAEMPSIQGLYNEFRKDSSVVFLMVDADRNLEKSALYFERKGYDLPLVTATQSLPKVLFDGKLPTTVVINKTGKLVFKETGAANYNSDQFVSFIKELVEHQAPTTANY